MTIGKKVLRWIVKDPKPLVACELENEFPVNIVEILRFVENHNIPVTRTISVHTVCFLDFGPARCPLAIRPSALCQAPGLTGREQRDSVWNPPDSRDASGCYQLNRIQPDRV